MNSGRAIQTHRANADGRMLEEIVLWGAVEEVDKAETRGNNDIFKAI